jgi:S-adenosylmethionine:tRNA-ribosyltransferase-isomerase (queuine synthetase)
MTDRFKLQPTGRMTVIVEMEEHGPIEFKIEDLDLTLAVVGVLAKAGSMTVDSYTARHRKTLERLLPEKED